MGSRRAIEIGKPDFPMVIFCDQVTWVRKQGNGCMIRTSDNTTHNFESVSFERMCEMLDVTLALH
jgi:hypothetical protein